LKSGNASILRGGSEAIHSNLAIAEVLADALTAARLPKNAIQVIPTTEREAVQHLLKLDKYVDVIIPRGGKGLIETVMRESTIPVVKHYEGICHTYVDAAADLAMAKAICFNAKVQRPGVCNAMETMLVHKDVAEAFLPGMCRKLARAGVEIRGCERTREFYKKARPATEEDWRTEYLDLILSVRVVASINAAIGHIANYGSHHSDAIVTDNYPAARKFLHEVDSAAVYVNASTRFTDGYEFGLGAEIGISTNRLHCRGPMGLRELTCTKYQLCGSGQIRT
jgi:glutamate-5-semialdehyde dehydrogenase